jgi:hypothetical protein
MGEMINDKHRRHTVGAPVTLTTPLATIADRLCSHASTIIETTSDRLYREIPTYSSVPRESLHKSLRQHLVTAAESLDTGRVPDHVRDVSVAAERAREGVPIEDVLLAIRLSFQSIREYFATEAESIDVAPRTILEGTQILWEVNDLVSREHAVSHRAGDLEIARRDENYRVEFVRSVLLGSISASELSLHSGSYGVTLDKQYTAFRSRPPTRTDAHTMGRRFNQWAKDHNVGLLSATFDGDLVGLATDMSSFSGTIPVGVGPPTHLNEINTSFRNASQALEIGTQFGYTGLITLGKLSLRVAVASEHALGTDLVARYIAPLISYGHYGTLLMESVDAYLESNLETASAAEKLIIHPNTLRYRINRFRKITGARLSSPVETAEVWWALRRHEWETRTGFHTSPDLSSLGS